MAYSRSRLFVILAVLLNGFVASAQGNDPRSVISGAGVPVPLPGSSPSDSQAIASSSIGACLLKAPPYPLAALRGEKEGRTVVSFEVLPSGVAGKPALLQSSKHVLLDKAALEHLNSCIAAASDTGPQLKPGTYALPMVWRIE